MLRKIVAPVAASRSLTRSLTRSAPHRASLLSFTKQEATMALYQHIEELRAELNACIDRREKAQITAELRAAEAELAAREAALDRELAAAG
ncbi:hypothetical protein BJF93_23125 [Xaviernesmea oryzae]|uniref:Uncharacterized protein n=2 Tax=Xaviernesmea oryzae TaxID=464029 RepID=A0A1Q9AU50_9HYPH|nr:hypothetical protein BJF93_23125 [Xaviernesmea oryzae]